jgi:predicted enzyme related to lactoylglutathione lyase
MRARMKLLAAFTAAAVGSPPPASAAPLAVDRFGLYVAVDDLDRAADFYAALFGKAPQVRSEGLVGFDVAGGLYALVSKKAYRLAVPPGGAVRSYVKVGDIDAAFERVRRLAPGRLESEAVVSEGSFRFFRFRDPEGNVVEFFALGPRR